MTTPSQLEDITPLRHGLGLQLNTDAHGRRYIGHSGAVDGFAAEASGYPDVQMAVVVPLNSNGNLNPGAVAGQLAAEVLPGILSR
jgi:hypothetical protein